MTSISTKYLLENAEVTKNKDDQSNPKNGGQTPKPPMLFFLLLAAKVRSSCEEGPGQSALQSAYHNPKLDVIQLKQNRTP